MGGDLDILCSIASDDALLLVEETPELADTVPPFMEDVALLVGAIIYVHRTHVQERRSAEV